MNMKPKMIPIAILLLGLASCVSKKQFDELQARFNTTHSENQGLRTELASEKARILGLEDIIKSERANNEALQDALNKCLNSTSQGNVNIAKLVDEINASNNYIKKLVDSKNKSDSLNMVLSNNLTRSLSREEMRDIDVQVLKGVVYISLSDNMLYKSGSYEISPAASQSLSKIAKIIKDYKDYEVLIEGNTDNIPIKKENIRNNWDLSTLRASSVVQALQNQYGVDPKRLTAGGRGEFNPIASNDSPAGRERNRRTQIIITPKLDQFMELIEQKPTAE